MYAYKDFHNIDIFNTTYKIKLKGYYFNFNKESFVLEIHEEKYLLEDYKRIGINIVPIKFNDIIIEITDQERLYKINEEITLEDIIDRIGPIIKGDDDITFNSEWDHKLIECNEKEFMKHLFDIDYSPEPTYSSQGSGMSRAFVKPILLNPKEPIIVTDPKGELFLTEGSSVMSKIKIFKLKK